MKPYRFENGPLLKAYSKRPGSDNVLDLRRVNERRNRIETDAVTNENRAPCKQCLSLKGPFPGFLDLKLNQRIGDKSSRKKQSSCYITVHASHVST